MTTFTAGEQTHPGVLPQRRALESVGADNPGSRDETAHGRPGAARDAGREHGRGETGGSGSEPRRRHTGPSVAAATGEPVANGGGDAPETTPGSWKPSTSRVFVHDRHGQPLMPCHPARARELLGKGRAVIVRQTPFTIRLRDRTVSRSQVDGVHLRIDPGSKGTGMALTVDRHEHAGDGRTHLVRRGLMAVELRHRSERISLCMRQRAGFRRRRRSANCRYRALRRDNRTRPAGWLPPSLRHRVDTVVSLARRFCRYAPVTEIHVESTAFDTQSISSGRRLRGAEHQQGTLAGTDARTYLRQKWGDACAYCDATDLPLNIEHIHPRSRGGSDRIANLVLACVPCNQAKGAQPIRGFLATDPERLARFIAQTKPTLRDAAAMNSTGKPLLKALTSLGRPVHAWTGAQTHTNRELLGLVKSHTLDALVVGPLGTDADEKTVVVPRQILVITATGRGSYARTTPDRFGFPRLRRDRRKRHFGYVTGDLVRATVPDGKWAGIHTGRISVRARGQHSLATPQGRINVSYRCLSLLQRGDGYGYAFRSEVGPVAGSPVSRKTG
ncbi:RNA-guided endonuclease IscB [Streptomyces sp. NPDC059524]|uniref:RNA-guided endonuclease IscB n=1 Tax=Streptomyces sp. NPDC059524 TaxID=3346856 RepID=UPI0036923AB8